MFGISKPKPVTTSGYHVSDQFNVSYLETFLNCLSSRATVIQIVAVGSGGQSVYVVYKI